MTTRQLLKVLEANVTAIICWASTGQELYRGNPLITKVPEHILNYYVTLLIPHTDRVYIEVYDNPKFMGEE